jgi:hypothetical protein
MFEYLLLFDNHGLVEFQTILSIYFNIEKLPAIEKMDADNIPFITDYIPEMPCEEQPEILAIEYPVAE